VTSVAQSLLVCVQRLGGGGYYSSQADSQPSDGLQEDRGLCLTLRRGGEGRVLASDFVGVSWNCTDLFACLVNKVLQCRVLTRNGSSYVLY
jgi:hypothetical protein